MIAVFLKKNSQRVCDAYPDANSLFKALLKEEPNAIRCLSYKISNAVFRIGTNAGLSDQDIEELHCDCILIFLRKVQSGTYAFKGFEPTTYVIEIARRRAFYYQRRLCKGKMLKTGYQPEESDEAEWDFLDQAEMFHQIFLKIDEKCQHLITLRYYDSLSDKEVIEKKLTRYSTVASLKTHRAKCMRKLAEMVARFMESE